MGWYVRSFSPITGGSEHDHGIGRTIEGSAVRHDRIISSRLGRRLGHLALFVALAVVPVLALNSFATADTGTDPAAGSGGRTGVTTAQRECLAGQGVTLPTAGSGGERSSLTTEQRQALLAAARACGLHGPWLRFSARDLTDAQRQCLAEQGRALLLPGADGSRSAVAGESRVDLRARLRADLRAAAEACGLAGPGAAGSRGSDGSQI